MSDFDFSDLATDPVPDDTWIDQPSAEPTGDALEDVDKPSPDVLGETKRSRRAHQYEKKTLGFISVLTKSAIRANDQADAAALIMYGPDVAQATGDLADADERIRRGIDMLSEGVSNPYLNFAGALLPLALQVIRNHEPILEPKPRGIRIPFTKKEIKIPKFGVKLGLFRDATHDPKGFTEYVFTDERIIDKLKKLNLDIVSPNGHDVD